MARVTFEIEEAERRLSIARELPITKKVTDTMFSVLREMAAMSHGGHRVKPGDVLIAATAQDAVVDVLHYDHHFDRLKDYFEFRSIWISPPGSI